MIHVVAVDKRAHAMVVNDGLAINQHLPTHKLFRLSY